MILFLLGATGTGKSAVALAWARERNAAVLAMDAMQVYRGADIGTSKPAAAERAERPHGGLDLTHVGAAFNVADYLAHAETFLAKHAGRDVVIVGGTGLYFRALTRGLCAAPAGSPELRAELATLSVSALRDRLLRVDPAILPQLDAANPRRLARAIEVAETSGRSLRAWQAETPAPLVRDFQAIWLQRERAELHARIERRLDAMLAAGWLEEVRDLVAEHGAAALESFPAIGYRELAQVLGDQLKLAEAREKILYATRQYARRQLTWFSREPSLRVMALSGAETPPAALLTTTP
jgi:tRNA dimethylallyltransferase